MIERNQGESLLDYKIRLCKLKEIEDLTWQDITNCINSESEVFYSPDTIRKWWKIFSQAMEYTFSLKDNAFGEDIFADIEKKKQELFKEKVKFQDQKRELNNLLRNEARFEHIRDEIVKAANELNQKKHFIYKKTNNVSSDREAVLLVGDIHKGMVSENHWNKYNDEIYNKRLSHLLAKTIEYAKFHQCKTLHCSILGDLINGWIHISSRILASENVIQQTMHVSEDLAEFLYELSLSVDELYVYGVRGNHDRVTPSYKEALSDESFADIVYWWMEMRLSAVENVKFVKNEIDEELSIADVCGYTCYSLHGHKDSPADAVEKWSMLTKKVPDYVFMGHYHHKQEDEIQGADAIVNPSFCGVDEYAKDKRLVNKPAQTLMIFTPDEGRQCTYKIRLDKV